MPNGSVFFAMEHLQGDDLGKLLRRHKVLPWSRARRILLQMCRALQAAHSRGIIHRDMKPENCFIIQRNGMRDFVKVLDFGIAKFLEENRHVSHTLTQAGALIGTPEYMAPEQVQGEAADVRMDIYALGCIMYQLLTGQLPFSDKTMFGVLSQQVNVRPVSPRQLAPDSEIPVEVEAIILKAMEKDKALRFQSMAELIEAIIAAPRGTADGRSATTSNLDAAASAARMAAAMNAASAQALSAVTTPTPHDVSLQQFATPSNSGATDLPESTSAGLSWQTGRNPQLMTKLVIGLGVVVLLLLVSLFYAINRGDEPEATVPAAEPIVIVAPSQDDTDEPTEASTGAADIVLDEEPEVPVKKPTTSPKHTTKKDPKPTTKAEPLPPPTIDSLDPRDRRIAIAKLGKDFENCRAQSSAAKGSIVRIQLKVEGATGRVLEAKPLEASLVANCIAKAVKSKARFPRFKQTTQQFDHQVSL